MAPAHFPKCSWTAIHHTAEARVVSTSSCHSSHPSHPQFQPPTHTALAIPWVPVCLGLSAGFKIKLRLLSQNSAIRCQLISKHSVAVQAWITFFLETAPKMQTSRLCSSCSYSVHVSLEGAAHLGVTLSSAPTGLSFDGCHNSSVVHLLGCPLTQTGCELRAAGTVLGITEASQAC